MKNWLIRIFMKFNTALIQLSGGLLGAKMGSQAILLLHNVGRKSGKKFITPIAYFELDEIYFVVASNWGKQSNAAWYHNLLAQPRAHIQLGNKLVSVIAREARDDEYERLWKFAVSRHPAYLDYQKMTARRIPIIVFVPLAG